LQAFNIMLNAPMKAALPEPSTLLYPAFTKLYSYELLFFQAYSIMLTARYEGSANNLQLHHAPCSLLPNAPLLNTYLCLNASMLAIVLRC
jgi:hypothetical protein